MKAVVFTGVGGVETADVPDAEIRQPRDAILKVERTSICGSDLHPYRGEWGDPKGWRPGHEFIGTIVAVGGDVRRRRVGDRVLASGASSCGVCAPCELGLVSKCAGFNVLGIPMLTDYPGGQAEYVTVPNADTMLAPIPDGASPEQALLLTDALATGWQGAQRARIREGDSVAVIGFGPIGMCAAMSSRALGAWEVFVLDPLATRRSFAEELGYVAFDSGDPNAVAEIRERSGGGCDGAVETAGRNAAIRAAIGATHAAGAVSVISVPSEDLSNELPDLLAPTQRYRRTDASPQRAWPQLIPLLGSPAFAHAERVFSHRLPLGCASEAYELFSSRPDECRKVQFEL